VPRRPHMLTSFLTLKTAAAAAAGSGLLLTGGVAAAATGSLPGAAQGTAQEWLAKVGVEVPGPAESSAGNADERGASGEEVEVEDAAGTLPDAAEKGETVSELARETEGGREKGEQVSEVASDGKSQPSQRPSEQSVPQQSSPAQEDTAPTRSTEGEQQTPAAGGETADEATTTQSDSAPSGRGETSDDVSSTRPSAPTGNPR
jgi:hypothetical protein